MKTRLLAFNIILMALLLPLVACKSTPERKKKKEITVLRLHLQADTNSSNDSQPVPIFREKPVLINVDKAPFLTEAYITKATIVDWQDAFYIQLKFDWHGTLMLDNITSANRGQRIVIYTQFEEEERWLAGPKVTQRIADGVLTFTPDATRAEAERIVNGLNNVAEKVRKSEK